MVLNDFEKGDIMADQKLNRVIITGASGPLGVVLIQECIRKNIEVLALVRPKSKKIADIPKHPLVQIILCDVAEILEVVDPEKQNYDACFHLAWSHTGDAGRHDPALQEENIRNTLRVAAFAKKMNCKVFVGAGSQAEYGIPSGILDEESVERPNTMYGVAKLAAGKLVMEYCRQNAMRCNWVRIFAVYGPYENDYIFTAYLIRKLLKKEKALLTPCEQIWDYLYCEDAARALRLVAEKAKESSVYCLGSGKGIPLYQYVLAIRNAVDRNIAIGIGEKPYNTNQIMHLEADISKLHNDVGFAPKIELEEGIQRTVMWHKTKIDSII